MRHQIATATLTDEVITGYLRRGGLAGLPVIRIAGCSQMLTTAATVVVAKAESRKQKAGSASKNLELE